MNEQKYIVGPESVRMIELGHPWIIADAYTKKWPKGKAGDIIALADPEGRFLATALLDPADRIVARVLSRQRMKLDRPWLKKKVQAAVTLRTEYADLDDTTAYRLVNGEGDGLPGLTVDRYGDYLVIQLYAAAWRPHLEMVTAVLQEMLSPAGIYEKARPQNTRELEAASDTKVYAKLLAGVAAPERLPVAENGLHFLVSLERGLNTGLFLDMRRNRREFMKQVQGKRVLNLFSHTAAFSVAAAAVGARSVTSVDASPHYTEWAKANFEANRLNPKRHAFIVGDCLEVLRDLAGQGKVFDVILMDPPSFSTTGKSRFTTRGGTSDLVAASLPLLVDGGLLITSSNHQKVDLADYLKEIRRGALAAGADVRVIQTAGQSEDFPYQVTFPEGRYLKYVVGVKTAG